MKINDTLLSFWKLDARCFLCSPDTSMASDNTQWRAVGESLTKHNLADVRDLMVLISVDSLWKYECDRLGHISCIGHIHHMYLIT
jgi:hypothetical protein